MNGENHIMLILNEKKAREAILTSDQEKLSGKKRGALYNDKEVNSPGQHENP
jgi:hypothetical protein